MRGILTVVPIKNETFISMNTHEEIQGKECVLLEAKVGEEAWLAVKIPEDTFTPWHRIHTSLVTNIEEEDLELLSKPAIPQHKVYISTENSMYTITSTGESHE